MKINLAVYTAQEGYSWQPGTSLSAEQLRGFKSCIGKFPAMDSEDIPFGGIFLKDDQVVFYRYHVAKKIDFRGRDALYCVLGVVPKDKAAEVDPKSLFALPQFATPMQPFPVEAEVPPSELSRVPDWLKNLEDHSLDVRIPGSLDDLQCKVTQTLTKEFDPLPTAKPVIPPSVPQPVNLIPPSGEPIPPLEKQAEKPTQKPVQPVAHVLKAPVRKVAPCYKNIFVVVCGLIAVLLIAVAFLLVSVISSRIHTMDCESKGEISENGSVTAESVRPLNAHSGRHKNGEFRKADLNLSERNEK